MPVVELVVEVAVVVVATVVVPVVVVPPPADVDVSGGLVVPLVPGAVPVVVVVPLCPAGADVEVAPKVLVGGAGVEPPAVDVVAPGSVVLGPPPGAAVPDVGGGVGLRVLFVGELVGVAEPLPGGWGAVVDGVYGVVVPTVGGCVVAGSPGAAGVVVPTVGGCVVAGSPGAAEVA